MGRIVYGICAGAIAAAAGCGTLLGLDSPEPPPAASGSSAEGGADGATTVSGDVEGGAGADAQDGPSAADAAADATLDASLIGLCAMPGQSCAGGKICCSTTPRHVCKGFTCQQCTPANGSCFTREECCEPLSNCLDTGGGLTRCCTPSGLPCDPNGGASCCSGACGANDTCD